jgi:benzil reductase ((S)-benzoin forming)
MTVFITGVSKGIGKALAEFYLKKGERVVGVGRSHEIQHENFSFLTCDLSKATEVDQLKIDLPSDQPLIWINNAGIVGEIQRISDQEKLDTLDVIQVNFNAAAQFMYKISRICGDLIPLTIVNISSGAGKRAIPSWASYCASKAALDIFSVTFYQEEVEKGRKTNVYAVAPGVIDTDMQKAIRSTPEKAFSSHAKFVRLKEMNELDTVDQVAKKLNQLLELDYSGEVICSLPELY